MIYICIIGIYILYVGSFITHPSISQGSVSIILIRKNI